MYPTMEPSSSFQFQFPYDLIALPTAVVSSFKVSDFRYQPFHSSTYSLRSSTAVFYPLVRPVELATFLQHG